MTNVCWERVQALDEHEEDGWISDSVKFYQADF